MKILVIPDTQVKQGCNFDHLRAAGNYMVKKKPEVVVMIGDHFDMPSLSTFTKRRQIEGRRVLIDLNAGYEAMQRLMQPLIDYNKKQKKQKMKQYHPRLEFCLGNHEFRVERYIDDNPELDGLLEYPGCFRLEKWGWNVNEFKGIVEIEGFLFSHYFYALGSGRPYGGTGHNKLNKIKSSFVMGHQQIIDIATATGNDGKRYWGITSGAFYSHYENYIGPQGNGHHRGLIMLHDVNDGDCSPCIVGLEYLMKKYLY